MGIIRMLEFYGVELRGKNAVVIGRGNVVGKPLAFMLLERDATVTICHSKTRNLADHTRNADIIIAAAGVPGLLKADMVKGGAYVIDVGTTKVGDKTMGDVDFDSVIKKANCSPVPGGVGPMTVAMLISNVVEAARRREAQ
jgi:methylenetetrahydrofolate dehydrogenase (NADP+)/methenyltetrahydrofolate cyclohydrolase